MAPPTPADEGSPGRLIAAMVGIVGILLLGSLAWSAVGALFSAVGEAAHALSNGTPAPKLVLTGPSTSSAQTPAAPTPQPNATTTLPERATPQGTPQPEPTSGAVLSTAFPTSIAPDALTPIPVAQVTPNALASGRAPWILLPGPAPGAHVQPGAQVIEARGRGDSAITAIRLELDGSTLGVSLEQRSESVWRGSATTQVGPGQHTARAVVVDDQGRTGSFRWTFEASP